jgi:hypothetical protein
MPNQYSQEQCYMLTNTSLPRRDSLDLSCLPHRCVGGAGLIDSRTVKGADPFVEHRGVAAAPAARSGVDGH